MACNDLCTGRARYGNSMTFSQRLAQAARMLEARLARILDEAAAGGAPPRLVAAMRHAALGGEPSGCDRSSYWNAPRCSAWRRRLRCRPRRRSNACIATRSSTTISPPWTTTTCVAASRPCTRLSTSGRRFWPAMRSSLPAFALLAAPQTHADPAVRAELAAGWPGPPAPAACWAGNASTWRPTSSGSPSAHPRIM